MLADRVAHTATYTPDINLQNRGLFKGAHVCAHKTHARVHVNSYHVKLRWARQADWSRFKMIKNTPSDNS